MFCKKIVISLMFIAATTLCSESNAQTLDHLPGYKFNPKDIQFLSNYTIVSDDIKVLGRGVVGVERDIVVKNNNSIISIHIHLAQDKTLNAAGIVKNIVEDPSLATGFGYIKKDHKKVGIGEVLYGSGLGPIKGVITSGALFSRKNVVIELLDETTKGKNPNLEPLARQIDKDIDSKVRVTLKEMQSHLPVISDFSASSNTAKEFSRQNLTVKISDPNGFKLKRSYAGNVLVKQTSQGDRMKVSGGPSVETVTLIVVNDHLLYSEKTIKITVTK